ncbi:MAG: hypothetical protein ABIX46_10525 [Burkholderiaceae bacterium]
MMSNLQALARGAVMARITLLINHVLSSEPIAMQRLLPHAGRSITVDFAGWPSLLPALPTTRYTVTPAGLVEWSDGVSESPADLTVSIDAANPARMAWRSLAGQRPSIEVQGDAAFAGDVNWLFDNLRWDLEDDVAKLVGAGPARELSRLASAIASAMRGAARGLSGLKARARGEGAGPPPR